MAKWTTILLHLIGVEVYPALRQGEQQFETSGEARGAHVCKRAGTLRWLPKLSANAGFRYRIAPIDATLLVSPWPVGYGPDSVILHICIFVLQSPRKVIRVLVHLTSLMQVQACRRQRTATEVALQDFFMHNS